jgi:hypothetical protein
MLQNDYSKKIFSIIIALCLIVCSAIFSINYACANTSKIVEGKIVDIFIDCKNIGFDTPIAPGDYVKVNVKNVRTMNKKTVGDLVSVIKHTPSK